MFARKKGQLGEHFNWRNILAISWKQRKEAGSGNVSMLMICLPFVFMSILVLFKEVAWKVVGDKELNPGLYDLLKSVQGSFSQGNVGTLGETARPQCACNALFSICWSLVRKISCWITPDLYLILILGDNLYKPLNKKDFYLVMI